MHDFPYEKIGDLTLVADMSSCIGTSRVDWDKYGVVIAGSHKNLGPSGVTVAVINEELIGH